MANKNTSFRHLDERDVMGDDERGIMPIGNTIRMAGLDLKQARKWLIQVENLTTLLKVVSGTAKVEVDPDFPGIMWSTYDFSLGTLNAISHSFEKAGWSDTMMREFLTKGITETSVLAVLHQRGTLVDQTVVVDSDALPSFRREVEILDHVGRGKVSVIPASFVFERLDTKELYQTFGLQHDEDEREELLTEEEKRLNEEATSRFERWRNHHRQRLVNATVAPHIVDHMMAHPFAFSSICDNSLLIFAGTKMRLWSKEKYPCWMVSRNGNLVEVNESINGIFEMLPGYTSRQEKRKVFDDNIYVVCYRTSF